jgi:hypothetical protein
MGMLTDSDNEIIPADDEFDLPEVQAKQGKGRNKKKYMLDDDDLSTFCSDMEDNPFFSSDEDESYKKKNFRNLAEGKNLNNSFRCLTADHWDHLHVDKGPNTQFKHSNEGPKMGKQQPQSK